MDLPTVAAVAREATALLPGAVLSRVVQTAPETLVLEWWAGRRGELRLVVSAEPEAPRVHFTSQPASTLREVAPPAGGPPRFAAWLRAHAQGARVLDVLQPPGERVVVLRLGRGGRAEDAPARPDDRLDLVVELFGPQAQVLVVGADGRVREALRRVTGAGGRRLAPGDPYAPPARPGRRPFAALTEAVADLTGTGRPDVQALARCAAGMTVPLGAHLLAEGGGSDGDAARLVAAARELVARVEAGRFEPRLYRRQGDAPLLAMLPLAHLEPTPGRPLPGIEVETFETASAAVEARYASPADRLARRAAPLRARLARARERLVRRLAALGRDRAQLARAADARRLGDLLSAQRHLLARGQREVRLTDLFDPEAKSVTVALDPALDPQGNIEACYARARKSRRGLETVAAREVETQADLEYVDQALYALDAAETPEELAALEAELADEEVLGPTPPAKPRRGGAETGRRGRAGSPASQVRRFRSTDGIDILAGKTNVSNDYLSTRLARPDDLWLHAEGYPGAHVLVRRAGRAEVPERTVLEAAAIAAFHSKARGAARVAVHVAPGSAVRKPRGARPGLVTLAGGHRSVVVAPDPDLVARLALPAGD